MKRLIVTIIMSLTCAAATQSFRNTSEKPILLEVDYQQGVTPQELNKTIITGPVSAGATITSPSGVATSVPASQQIVTQTWRTIVPPGATLYPPSGTWSLRKIRAKIETYPGQFAPISEFEDNESGNAGYTLSLPIQQSRVEITKN